MSKVRILKARMSKLTKLSPLLNTVIVNIGEIDRIGQFRLGFFPSAARKDDFSQEIFDIQTGRNWSFFSVNLCVLCAFVVKNFNHGEHRGHKDTQRMKRAISTRSQYINGLYFLKLP